MVFGTGAAHVSRFRPIEPGGKRKRETLRQIPPNAFLHKAKNLGGLAPRCQGPQNALKYRECTAINLRERSQFGLEGSHRKTEDVKKCGSNPYRDCCDYVANLASRLGEKEEENSSYDPK